MPDGLNRRLPGHTITSGRFGPSSSPRCPRPGRGHFNERLPPYRKRTSLTPEEIDRLYDCLRACLLEAIEKVRAEMGEAIHLKPQK